MTDGPFKINVTLDERAGALAAFAAFLKNHQANVIYMSYHGQRAPGTARIAMAPGSAEEIARLIEDLDRHGYRYQIE